MPALLGCMWRKERTGFSFKVCALMVCVCFDKWHQRDVRTDFSYRVVISFTVIAITFDVREMYCQA